jgi:glycerol-3-phosphate acyltransferase PlsY
MNLWISILLVWLLASLPFAYVVARIIYFGSSDHE